MTMFKKKSGTLVISEPDPIYKVRYLGNVLTAIVKGDGCVDRPILILWNNYNTMSTGGTQAGLEMEMTVCNSGLKVITKEQGLTEYRAHRITYNVCPDQHPKLFVWVYKHEGRRLKAEVRCHAVLCKTETMAQMIDAQLHDRLVVALDEFRREKRRSETSRTHLRASVTLSSNDLLGGPGGSVRTKFLKLGHHFRPPIGHSNSAPKLGCITEGDEDEPATTTSDAEDVDNRVMSTSWLTADSATEPDYDSSVSSSYSSYTSGPNGHVSGMGVANDDDVAEPLSSSVSCLQVTCDNGSDDGACVEMHPAAGGVDSDEENEIEDEKPSQRLS